MLANAGDLHRHARGLASPEQLCLDGSRRRRGPIFHHRRGVRVPKSAIDTLVLVAITVAFYRGRFFLALPHNIFAVLAGYLVILILLFVGLFYRNSDAQLDLASVFAASSFDIKEMLATNSYIMTYTFISNVYDATTYYYWSLLGDLKTSLLPSSLFPDKAVGDDGVYVRYAVQGMFLDTGRPSWSVIADSMPPETMGSAYMNGGPFVVPFYGIAAGKHIRLLPRARRAPAERADMGDPHVLGLHDVRAVQPSARAAGYACGHAAPVALAVKPIEMGSALRLRSA